jgi:GNAT superfamily N-acetyltransferase
MQSEPFQYEKDGFTISTDRRKLDFALIHDYLANRSYWSPGIPRRVVEQAAENSLCYGVYAEAQQVGYARVVTDYATFAYLCDVFILEDYRGRGLSKWLMACVLSHPDLQGIRRWSLVTRDAHGLYAQYGFVPVPNPEGWMVRINPMPYQSTWGGEA